MLLNKMMKYLAIASMSVLLSACATMSSWFADDEELEIKKLPIIQNQFELTRVWSSSVGDGVDDYFSRLRPAVTSDRIYAADREGRVVALSRETGDIIWEKDFSRASKESSFSSGYGLFAGRISAKISGGITLAGNKLLFGTEDGIVYSLNPQDGAVQWQANVPSEVVSAPAYDSGVVIVSTVAGTLVGIDSTTGKVKWQNESDVPVLTLRGVSSPVAAAGGAIVGLANGRVRVAILENGLTAWEAVVAKPAGATDLERIVDVDTTPLVFGGSLFVVSYGGTLAAIELRTGNVIWSREYAGFRNVSIDGNRLFVTDSSNNLYAIDRRNGVELWSNGELRKRSLTAATPVGDYVAVGDKFGYLHLFSQDEGKYVSRFQVGDDDEDEGIYVAPVYANGSLVVQTRDGQVNLLRMPN